VERSKKKIRDPVTSIFKGYAWVRDNDFAMITKKDLKD
jgi:hypothetical protein